MWKAIQMDKEPVRVEKSGPSTVYVRSSMIRSFEVNHVFLIGKIRPQGMLL